MKRFMRAIFSGIFFPARIEMIGIAARIGQYRYVSMWMRGKSMYVPMT